MSLGHDIGQFGPPLEVFCHEPGKRNGGGKDAKPREAIARRLVGIAEIPLVQLIEMPARAEGGAIGGVDGVAYPTLLADEASVAVIART